MLSIYFRSLVLRQCCIDGHSANQYVQIKAALWSHSGYDAEQQERRAGRVGLPPPGGEPSIQQTLHGYALNVVLPQC